MPVVNFMGHNFQAVASNWIAVSRDVRDHHLVGFGQPVKAANPKKGAFSRAEAWLDLIMLARWKDGPEMNKGRKVDMLAGQLQGGYSFLADRWNWTVQTVRTFIGKLVGERMIDRAEEASESNKRNNNQTQVLTVCNYKRYQLMHELMDMQDQQASNKRATSEQQHLNKETLIQEDKSPIGDSSPAVQGDLLGAAPPKPKARAKAKPRVGKSLLPEDWILPAEWRDETKLKFGATDSQIDRQAERFKRWWLSPDSKNRLKADWKSTWLNWIDSAQSRGQLGASGANGVRGNGYGQPARRTVIVNGRELLV